MEKKISLQDLADALASRKNISRREADTFVRNFFECVTLCVVDDKVLKIKGLGTFKLIEVASRESVNVNTGERIVIPGHSKVSFAPDTSLRDQVNKPFADFQTVILNENTPLDEMERTEPVTPLPVADFPEETDDEDDLDISVDEVSTVSDDVEQAEEHDDEDIQSEATTEEVKPVAADTAAENVEPQAETATEVHAVATVPAAVSATATPAVQVVHKGISPWFALLYALVTLLLMGLSYYLGYSRILSLNIQRPKTEQTQVVRKKANVSAAQQQKAAAKPKPKPSPTDLYPQVPGGKYLIVGTRRVHIMRVGDSILKLAVKEYGHKDFAQYIIVFNQFPNPDVISVGAEVKIPELKENK